MRKSPSSKGSTKREDLISYIPRMADASRSPQDCTVGREWGGYLEDQDLRWNAKLEIDRTGESRVIRDAVTIIAEKPKGLGESV